MVRVPGSETKDPKMDKGRDAKAKEKRLRAIIFLQVRQINWWPHKVMQ